VLSHRGKAVVRPLGDVYYCLRVLAAAQTVVSCGSEDPSIAQHMLDPAALCERDDVAESACAQVPELARDIVTPDYCMATGELRAINAWLGPAGTVRSLSHAMHVSWQARFAAYLSPDTGMMQSWAHSGPVLPYTSAASLVQAVCDMTQILQLLPGARS